MAGRLGAPMAALEHPSWLNLGLGGWPLSGNRYGRFGHEAGIQDAFVLCRLCERQQPLAVLSLGLT